MSHLLMSYGTQEEYMLTTQKHKRNQMHDARCHHLHMGQESKTCRKQMFLGWMGHGPKIGQNEFVCACVSVVFTCILLVFHSPYIKPVGHGSIGLLLVQFFSGMNMNMPQNNNTSRYMFTYVAFVTEWVPKGIDLYRYISFVHCTKDSIFHF